VDLQDSEGFRELGVTLLSISPDSTSDWAAQVEELGITTPTLSDADNRVAERYDVLQWAAATGEPGHTFVLVDEEGAVRWIRDYGAPQNGGLMYVPPDELIPEIADHLSG
jgi:peroxiredoxin